MQYKFYYALLINSDLVLNSVIFNYLKIDDLMEYIMCHCYHYYHVFISATLEILLYIITTIAIIYHIRHQILFSFSNISDLLSFINQALR